MPTPVSDSRSNANDQIVRAAKVLGKSVQRRAVFEAIYFGKSKIKTVSHIADRTNLPRKRVLEEGKKLVNNQLVQQTKSNGETAYEKDDFYTANKSQILGIVRDPKRLQQFPTKVSPRIGGVITTAVSLPRELVRVRQLTVDDIDSFSKIRGTKSSINNPPLPEAQFKANIASILKKTGEFSDWGGEKNDLWTTRLKVGGKRYSAAFAFKGPGTRRKLTPKMMGKNADQIQRLFGTEADVFLVQYHEQIDESVVVQMRAFATALSALRSREIMFGVIDGEDTRRLVTAYPTEFTQEEVA